MHSLRFDNDCSNTFVATSNIQQVGFFPSMMDAPDIDKGFDGN
jgi:hypothetical protein